MTQDTLTITDNRTGATYQVPIANRTVAAVELRNIKVTPGDFGLKSFDPSLSNTATCRSRITHIDGEKGVLTYRGYPIEQLADKSNYLETAYLILNGDLPRAGEYESWVRDITLHTIVHENIKELMAGFRYDAAPMGMMVSTVAALATFYPEAKEVRDREVRKKQIIRLLAKLPTLAAFAYRHAKGLPYVYPDNELSYCGNFLQMMFRVSELRCQVHPVLERALDVLCILQADDAQDCSALVMRSVGSSEVDPYSAAAAAMAALYGPLHRGASGQVVRMLEQIGSKGNVPQFVQAVKQASDAEKLAGFGHRLFPGGDPRARCIRTTARQVFQATGMTPLMETALELERIALVDDFFAERQLLPNLDFYSGLIYQAMGFPVDMFPVLLAIGRISGWLGQWQEMLEEEEQAITAPRQVYLGPAPRDYVSFEARA